MNEIKRDKTTAQIMDTYGVQETTIRTWVNKGCPCDKGGKGIDRKFNENEVAKWLTEKNLSGKMGRPKKAKNQEIEELEKRKLQLMVRKLELEVGQTAGTLLNAEEVQRNQVQKVVALRNALLSIPSSIAPSLEGATVPEIQAELEKAIQKILTDFSKK